MSRTEPTRARVPARLSAVAATAVGLTALGGLGACTAPDGGAAPDPALQATVSAVGGGSQASPTTDEDTAGDVTDAPVQMVRAADGTETWVSAGSAEVLAEVPVEIPLVAGDADLVQVTTPADRAASSYQVIITSPGSPGTVYADVAGEFAAAGFTTEDVSPETGTPVESTAAATFASDAYRVTVGLVPAGRASTTVTYVIVPIGG
jgi:hypothetical protein